MVKTKVAPNESNRLTLADYLFAWQGWELGASFRCQVYVELPGPLSMEEAERLYGRLQAGPLSKVVVRSRVPGARPYWRHSSSAGELVVDKEAVAHTDYRPWLDEQLAAADFDVEHGPVWRMSMSPTENGGTLLSLGWLHAVSDGLGAVAAIAAAMFGADIGCLPDDTAKTPGVLDDVFDLLGRIKIVLFGIFLVLAGLFQRGKEPGSPEPKPVPPKKEAAAPISGAPIKQRTSIIEFSKAAWSQAATTRAGSDNSLLVALSAQLAIATGCVKAADSVPVQLIVSDREQGARDMRGNALANTTVWTKATDQVHTDLSDVRQETKRALDSMKLADHRATESLFQLLYLLPNWALRRAAPALASSVDRCTTSNGGTVPGSLLSIGGMNATATGVRTQWFNIPENIERSFPANLGVAFFAVDDTAVLNVQFNDPNSTLSEDELNDIVITNAAQFGLKPTRIL